MTFLWRLLALLLLAPMARADVTIPCIDAHTIPAAATTVAVVCDHAFGTPKAVLALSSMAVQSGGTGTNARFSVGIASGTGTEQQYTYSVQDVGGGGASTSSANRRYSLTHTLLFAEAVGTTVEGLYALSSFTNNTVNLTSSNALSNDAESRFVLFGGSDLTVKVGGFNANGTIAGTITEAVGFLADIIFFFGDRYSTVDASVSNSYNCVGAAIQVGGIVSQAAITFFQQTGVSTSVVAALVEDRYACAFVGPGALQAIEISAIDSSGFTVTTRQETGGHWYSYLALSLGGLKTPFLQVITSRTTSGPDPIPIPGFTPEFALLLTTLAQATRTTETDSDANGWGVGVLTPTQAGSVGYVVEDNKATRDSLSFVGSTAVRLNTNTTTMGYEATGALSANTLTLNYSVATSPARKWVLVGWGAPITTTQRSRRLWQ